MSGAICGKAKTPDIAALIRAALANSTGVLNVIDPENWLANRALGYAQLNERERAAIAHFSLLWGLFELQVMNARANAVGLVRKVEDWDSTRGLQRDPFEGAFHYFRSRYFLNGTFGDLFEGLRFGRSDCRKLVEEALSQEQPTPKDMIAALLLITYRLRNNLFHGEKWAYGIRDQRQNFENANQVLMRALELS
ncbi:hypothetical protein ABID62_008414 [Bradyrhizobium sp. S3.9.1]|jgi:hypothetical protein|uniref:Apea-like HEPN domain-containing protein n=1 Tax=Bradyrhizobium japonicum TaxID=375 RepID=A0A1Y2J8P5_BRAJP|nr:hypothetical protein BSZ19_44900 [Bradyrhizobium japonicum]